MTRPTFCNNAHLEYLDALWNSGETDMFGILSYFKAEFNLIHDVAREIVRYWENTSEFTKK